MIPRGRVRRTYGGRCGVDCRMISMILRRVGLGRCREERDTPVVRSWLDTLLLWGFIYLVEGAYVREAFFSWRFYISVMHWGGILCILDLNLYISSPFVPVKLSDQMSVFLAAANVSDQVSHPLHSKSCLYPSPERAPSQIPPLTKSHDIPGN